MRASPTALASPRASELCPRARARAWPHSSRTYPRAATFLGWLSSVCIVLATLLAAGSACAQQRADGAEREPPRAALEHYRKGRELYSAGRYREAAVELEAALALDPNSPNLIYNLARVYELLGEIDTAILHYKRYRGLLASSEVEERARVTGTLQRLEGARHQVPDTPPTAPPPPPVARERGVADGTFWAFTTLAAASFVAGTGLGVAALNREKDAKRLVLDDDDSVARKKDLVSRTDRIALASDLTLLAGAVLGTTAILLYALREKPVQSAPRAVVDFGAGPGGAFLLLRGQL